MHLGCFYPETKLYVENRSHLVQLVIIKEKNSQIKFSDITDLLKRISLVEIICNYIELIFVK